MSIQTIKIDVAVCDECKCRLIPPTVMNETQVEEYAVARGWYLVPHVTLVCPLCKNPAVAAQAPKEKIAGRPIASQHI